MRGVYRLLGLVYKEINSIASPSAHPGIFLIPVSMFVAIGTSNSIGLLPYTFTASRHLVFSLRVAIPLWVGHVVYFIGRLPRSFLAHLVPLRTPGALIPFIVLIELIRRVIRPLTLSVRLAANIIAGHLLLTLLGRRATALSPAIRVIGGALVLLGVLECAVRIIQAYVFRILSSLYLNEANSPTYR